MKKNSFTVIAALFSVFSVFQACTDKDPIDVKEEKKPIDEVGEVLMAAGKVPELPNLSTKTVDTLKKEPAPGHTNEVIGGTGEHVKVTEKVNVDFSSSSDEFALLNPWPSVLWPGCLIQGGSLRGVNVPATIPLYEARKPGRIVLSIVSGAQNQDAGGEETWYEDVPVMRQSEVVQAQNRLVRRFMKSEAPAQTSFSIDQVFSLDDLAVRLGVDVKRGFGTIKTSFGGHWLETKTYLLVRLYQTFFTMSYEDPDGGFRGMFKEDTKADLFRSYTGSGNPICYVSSVSYGRVYYLLCESSLSAREVSGALYASFAGITTKDSLITNRILASTSVKLIQLGGDPKAGLAGTLDVQKVKTFIEEGAKFSKDNVGAPISFTVKHLYDNSLVRMSNTLKYSYQKTSFYPKTKSNNITINVKGLVVSTSGQGRYHVSNGAYMRIKKIHVEYQQKNDGIAAPITIYEDHAKTWSLTHTAYPSIYRSASRDCYGNVRSITLFAKLGIRPEAYQNGALGTGIGGSHTNSSEEEVDLVQTFTYSDQDGWQADNIIDPSTDNQKFSVIGIQRNIGRLDLNIRLLYSFYIDGALVGI